MEEDVISLPSSEASRKSLEDFCGVHMDGDGQVGMDADRHSRLRVVQTRWLMDDLASRLNVWSAQRRKGDADAQGRPTGKQRSQVEAVELLVRGCLDSLRTRLDDLGGLEPGTRASESWRLTTTLAWLERVWQYFRSKIDQRDGPLEPLLRAADEVVWSCWRSAELDRFERRFLALGCSPPPPPLAYVEPWFSPAALPGTARLSRTVPSEADLPLGIAALVQSVPVPLLRLPTWCTGAPWWLVFVAHEVGHHWQHALNLVVEFSGLVSAAAEAAGAPAADVDEWGRWGEEIFADLVSVLLAGPWALWAMAELVRGPAAEMARRELKYPPSLARLGLLAGALEELGLDPLPFLRGIDLTPPPGAPAALTRDLTVARQIARLCRVELPQPLGRLDQLCGFDAGVFQKYGPVEEWRYALSGQDTIVPPRQIDTGRHLVMGSLSAWAALTESGLEGEALRKAAEKLAGRTLAALTACAPGGDRAGGGEVGMAGTGSALADALLALSGEEET
jgi:hypothetical protein